MSATPSELADLRRRIDAIDDRMHDLLIERAEIVAEVAARKRDREVAFYQPAREAQILRRLAARHHGVLPVANVLRIWREMLGATVQLEEPFAIAVYAPAQAQGFWDLARDHYGSHASISVYGSTGEVIRAVCQCEAAVGMLPMPEEGEAEPWWPQIVTQDAQDDDAPRAIARLPFGPRGNARANGVDALVIGRGAQQQTGMDRTLFIAELGVDLCCAQFAPELSRAGLTCTLWARSEYSGGWLNLLEFDDFVSISDRRIADLRARLGHTGDRLLPFGGYALPLSMAARPLNAAKG